MVLGIYLTNQYQDENFLVSQGELLYATTELIGIAPFSPPNMGILDGNYDNASTLILTPASGTWSDFGFYVTTGWLGPTYHMMCSYRHTTQPITRWGSLQIAAVPNYTNQFFEVDDQPQISGAELPQGASQDDPAITGIAYVDITLLPPLFPFSSTTSLSTTSPRA